MRMNKPTVTYVRDVDYESLYSNLCRIPDARQSASFW